MLCNIPQHLKPLAHTMDTVSTPEGLSALFQQICDLKPQNYPVFHPGIIFEPAHRCLPNFTAEQALDQINQYYQKIWLEYTWPYLINGSENPDTAKAESDCAKYVLSKIGRLQSHAFYLGKYCEDLATDPSIIGDIVFHFVDASFARAISHANTRESFTDEESDDIHRWLTKAWKWTDEQTATKVLFVYLPDIFANSKEQVLYELRREKRLLTNASDSREFWFGKDWKSASELQPVLDGIIDSVDSYKSELPVFYIYARTRQEINDLCQHRELKGKFLVDNGTSAVFVIEVWQNYEACFVFWPELN